jgi:hypothetical protein
MIRKFNNICCIYFNDNSFIPAKYHCPDLEFDDVILGLTTNAETNYEKISEFITDYAFALFCSKSDLSDFINDHKKYRRANWRVIDFSEVKKDNKEQNDEVR